MERAIRTVVIGVLSFGGGIAVSQGAAHEWWRLIVVGLLLWSIALGIIVSSPAATKAARRHARAIVTAAWIARLFRLFR